MRCTNFSGGFELVGGSNTKKAHHTALHDGLNRKKVNIRKSSSSTNL
jgi:hypothetical protein